MPQTQGRHPDCSKPLCMVQLGIPDWACVLKRHQLHSLTCVLWLLIYCTQPTGHLLCREEGVRSGTEHLSQKHLKNHGKIWASRLGPGLLPHLLLPQACVMTLGCTSKVPVGCQTWGSTPSLYTSIGLPSSTAESKIHT